MWGHDDRVGAVLVQSGGQGRPAGRLQLRVEAAADRGELSAQDRVLKQQSGRDRQEVRTQILDLPLQPHPPVLEPRFHLGSTRQRLLTRTRSPRCASQLFHIKTHKHKRGC